MKKFLLLLVVVFAVVVVLWKQRIYIRDPLANVMRNGVKEDGAQVFINYSNDVLIENDHTPAYVLLVQHGGNAGTPAKLRCEHWVVCLADADVATLIEPMKLDVKEMSGKLVEFQDEKGRDVKVTLR